MSGQDNWIAAGTGLASGVQDLMGLLIQDKLYRRRRQEDLMAQGDEQIRVAQAEQPLKLEQENLRIANQQAIEKNKDFISGKEIQLANPDLDVDPNRLYHKAILPVLSSRSKKAETIGLKESQQQDRLEGQAISRLSSIRGDTSVARVEAQRDASIQAFNTINTIKQENRMPSQIEYYDIIGQMWKARTGQSPTDQAIRDLDAKTLKGDIGKAYQYFSGKPAGRTTQEILDNIQNFAKTSGEQADQLHEGYMSTHLIKPKGLDEDRWRNILQTHRGLTFEAAIKKWNKSKGINTPTLQPQGQSGKDSDIFLTGSKAQRLKELRMKMQGAQSQ